MNAAELSAVVLTYNEEANIARTLDRLRWIPEVWVVDSGSSDRTYELCANFENVHFIRRVFDSHAEQWNAGLDCVTNPWVLTLDADHILDEDWPQKWESCSGKNEGYIVKFRYVIQKRALRACLYPPKVVLFRKECGCFVQDGHTQRLELSGVAGSFPAMISHDDEKSFSRWVSNQTKYAQKEADKILSENSLRASTKLRRSGWVMPLVILPYCLLRHGLILDGRRGWIYSLQRLVAEVLIALAIFEKKWENKK